MASARVTRSKRRRLAAPPPAAAAANDGVLPMEMLLEVLLRLPAKELCRLRLVCRAWRSLTSDPGFPRAHSSHRRRRTLLVAGVCKRHEEIKLVDLLSGDVVKRIPATDARVKYGHNLSMQAGYFCVSESEMERPCVIDVATGAVTFLPAGVAAEVEHVAKLVKVVKSTSMLGRVPSTGEYKVLRIHQCLKRDGVNFHKCDVTTLGREEDHDHGRWRARPDPPMCISVYFERRIVVDGVAYFLSNPYDGNTGSSESIASFDLATEAWRPAMLRGPLSSHAKSPEEMLLVNTRGKDLQLNELDGCLVTVHRNYQDCATDLWFLVDADKEVWTKRYSVQWSSPDRRLNECNSFPLVVLDDGRIVVWIQREQALRAYDPKTCVWADLATVKDYFCIGMLKAGNLLCSGLQG